MWKKLNYFPCFWRFDSEKSSRHLTRTHWQKVIHNFFFWFFSLLWYVFKEILWAATTIKFHSQWRKSIFVIQFLIIGGFNFPRWKNCDRRDECLTVKVINKKSSWLRNSNDVKSTRPNASRFSTIMLTKTFSTNWFRYVRARESRLCFSLCYAWGRLILWYGNLHRNTLWCWWTQSTWYLLRRHRISKTKNRF